MGISVESAIQKTKGSLGEASEILTEGDHFVKNLHILVNPKVMREQLHFTQITDAKTAVTSEIARSRIRFSSF